MMLILALLAQDADWLPTRPGTTWTFRETAGANSREVEIRALAPTPGKGEFVEDMEPARKTHTLDTAAMVLLRRDGVVTHLVERTDGTVRLWRQEFKDTHTLDITLKTDLREGLSWKAPHVWLSCGFASVERTHTVAAERLTVPAGTFDAMRVDVADGHHRHSIWLARGVGIVKSTASGVVSELVKVEGSDAVLKALVAQWKSPKPEERDRASAELRAIGPDAAAAVRAAANDADLEVRARAKAFLADLPIVRQWTGGKTKASAEEVLLIRDAKAWAQAWKRHSDDPVPDVDFARHQALVVFHGEHSAFAGGSYAVTKIDASGDVAVVAVDRKALIPSGEDYRARGFAIVVFDRGVERLRVERTTHWQTGLARTGPRTDVIFETK